MGYKKKNGGKKAPQTPNTTGMEELKDHYFVIGTTGQAEKYRRTKEAIATYVGATFGKEMWTLVHELKEATFDEPQDIKDDATKGEIERYRIKMKMHLEEEKLYKRNKGKVFIIVIGQCTKPVKNKLASFPEEYKKFEQDDDVAGVLTKMKELVYNTTNIQYEIWTLQKQLRTGLCLRQYDREDLQTYSKRFLAQIEITEKLWGELIPWKMKDKQPTEQQEARNKILACVFLSGADIKRYRKAKLALNNNYIMGKNDYPADVPEMVKYLANFKGLDKPDYEDDDGGSATSFAQGVKCWACGKMGHYSRDCPDKSDDESESNSSYNSNGSNASKKKKKRSIGWAD